MKKLLLFVVGAVLTISAVSAQNVKYQGEVNVGYSIGVGTAPVNRANLNTIQGVKVGDYFSIGAGLGLDWWKGLYADYWQGQGKADRGELSVPIFLNVKGYLPVNERVAPYLSFDVGYNAGLTEGLEGFGGLLLTPAAGVMIGHFKVEAGITIQKVADNLLNINANAIKLGVGYVF